MGYYPPLLPNSVVDQRSRIPITQPKIGPVPAVTKVQLKALSNQTGAGKDGQKRRYPPLKKYHRLPSRGRGSRQKGSYIDCLA